LAVPTLTEAVNFATVVAARCPRSMKPQTDVDVAAFVLFIDAIEMADGVQVLLEQSATGPALVAVRSLIETTLYLQFILRADDGRSLAWLAEVLQNRITHLKALDPIRKSDSKRRKRSNLPPASKRDREISGSTRQEIAALERFLKKPHMAAVLARASEARTWYQAYGGGVNLEQLAGCLGRTAEYRVFYRYFSTVTHALDMWRRLTSDKGQPAIRPLRDPAEARSIASITCSQLLLAIRVMAEKYTPDVKYRDWYVQEVRKGVLGLSQQNDDTRG
jgi:hypothetical protein